MYKVDKTKISLIRGDTLILEVDIYDGDGDFYELQEGDLVHFTLKRAELKKDKTDYVHKEPVIEKIIPNETLMLQLDAEDTANLPFGRYVYNVQLRTGAGIVDTFIFNIFDLLSEEEAAELFTNSLPPIEYISGKLSFVNHEES